MKYLFCGLLCVALSLGEASAQQVIPPLKKEFLDSTFAVLPSAARARYRRETEWRDSTAGEVRDYFLSGQLQSSEQFEHIAQRRYHGVSEYFDERGLLLMHVEFAHTQRTGKLVLYYPSGQLKRREQYTGSERVAGECFAADGKSIPYFEYEVMPRYSGGDGSFQAIIAAIAHNFHYPKDARRAGVEGRVLLTFNVTQLGTVADVQVKEALFPSIDVEAVQAVYRLKRFAPGQQDGQPVQVSFTVPITLKLQ